MKKKLYSDYYDRFLDGELCFPDMNTQEEIVFILLKDLLNRRGYRQEFEEFDSNIQDEILDDWVDIVKESKYNAELIIDGIIKDISSRSGWESVYDEIDDDTKQEMIKDWHLLLKDRLSW